MQDIAAELHISSRTLQRRLQDAGYRFHQVLEEARRQLARHYLNHSLLELNETAYLLGYEDANSFVRAFPDLGGGSTRSLGAELSARRRRCRWRVQGIKSIALRTILPHQSGC